MSLSAFGQISLFRRFPLRWIFREFDWHLKKRHRGVCQVMKTKSVLVWKKHRAHCYLRSPPPNTHTNTHERELMTSHRVRRINGQGQSPRQNSILGAGGVCRISQMFMEGVINESPVLSHLFNGVKCGYLSWASALINQEMNICDCILIHLIFLLQPHLHHDR